MISRGACPGLWCIRLSDCCFTSIGYPRLTSGTTLKSGSAQITRLDLPRPCCSGREMVNTCSKVLLWRYFSIRTRRTTEGFLFMGYFIPKSSDEEIDAHLLTQAEGLTKLSPDTAGSGFKADRQNRQAEKACKRVIQLLFINPGSSQLFPTSAAQKESLPKAEKTVLQTAPIPDSWQMH